MNFIVEQVSDENTLKEIYRLRYKVYVEEWRFEKPEDHHQGVETDEFDKYALHFAAKDNSGNIVGTIRLVLPSPKGFPIEEHCRLNINRDKFPSNSIAEISRLAISKAYRKRTEDSYIYGPLEERRTAIINNEQGRNRRSDDIYNTEEPQERRRRHELVLSLYKAIYHESKRRGITHWYAVMARGLYILLKRCGFEFTPIGEAVSYHGVRTPYIGDIKEIEEKVLIKNPALYEEFTRDLKIEI
ncbi:MAG: PEP-CTERM/exosortase system-associated acyltransferase [Nitrospirae bacterium]|nr:PEP-CTERM/exosortase system-associated acyltransferase [Nitrospirota bacterium]